MADENELTASVATMRVEMVAAYNAITDPMERMVFLDQVAQLLGVKKSQVLIFLRSSGTPDIRPPRTVTVREE